MIQSFTRVSEHCYCLESKSTRRSLLGLITGDDQVLFVDAGISPDQMGTMLEHYNELNIVNELPALGIITDTSLKHILGMQACGKMPFISHKSIKQCIEGMKNWEFSDKFLEQKAAANEILVSDLKAVKKEWNEPRDVNLQVPCIMYRHKLEMDIGNLVVELIHIDSDNCQGQTILWVPKDGVLFIGDALEPGFSGHSAYYTKKIFAVLDTLMEYKAKYYITSKRNHIYLQNDFFEYCEYLKIIGGTVSDHYNDYSAIEEALGGSLDKEATYLIDAFMNGIKDKPIIF